MSLFSLRRPPVVKRVCAFFLELRSPSVARSRRILENGTGSPEFVYDFSVAEAELPRANAIGPGPDFVIIMSGIAGRHRDPAADLPLR